MGEIFISKEAPSVDSSLRVLFEKDNGVHLDLRLSLVATSIHMLNETGVNYSNAKDWLEAIGKHYIDEVKDSQVVWIMSNDLSDGELVTSWGNLKREFILNGYDYKYSNYYGFVATSSQEAISDKRIVRVRTSNQILFDISITNSAIASEPCGLIKHTDSQLHNWLWNTALVLIKEITNVPTAIVIDHSNVRERELLGGLETLIKRDFREDFNYKT